MTDKGLFHATSILIDGREYTTYAPDLDKTIIGLKGTRTRLELRGKLVGSRFEEILSINDIEKGEVVVNKLKEKLSLAKVYFFGFYSKCLF